MSRMSAPGFLGYDVKNKVNTKVSGFICIEGCIREEMVRKCGGTASCVQFRKKARVIAHIHGITGGEVMELVELLEHPLVEEVVGYGIIADKYHSFRIEHKRDIAQQCGNTICQIRDIGPCIRRI